jgi:hypothetical protein
MRTIPTTAPNFSPTIGNACGDFGRKKWGGRSGFGRGLLASVAGVYFEMGREWEIFNLSHKKRPSKAFEIS